MAEPTRPPIMRYFQFAHLPEQLQAVALPFSKLAYDLYTTLPAGPELSVALRKLLESKDAAVRAALDLPMEN
ncbi:hypothetical protein ACIQJW_26805 [Streptomyces californicus]|uniref:hypothetical protein n=1 Tax=Streptomyces californicus TaxID=67351 RepID=UPI0038254CC3